MKGEEGREGNTNAQWDFYFLKVSPNLLLLPAFCLVKHESSRRDREIRGFRDTATDNQSRFCSVAPYAIENKAV